MVNKKSHLDTKHLAPDMGHHAVRGGVASIMGQLAKFFIQLLTTVVLARLLVPEDFGLMAMIIAITAFLEPFKDFGLSTVTLQSSNINHAQVSNLFWINMLVAVILTLTTVVLSPLISEFYGQPILTLTICIFSFKFILEGLAFQHQALLRRQLRFGFLSILEISALLVASIAGIWAAMQDMGHWALVTRQLTIPLILTAAVWIACSWRPSLPTRNSGVRSMLSFGGMLTVSNILHALLSYFDNMLIGWRWGASALGQYTKAYALLLMPISQISAPLDSVAIATLSRLQDDPIRYKSFYCRLITILAFATTPLLVMMAVLSRDIIYLLLGEQWLEASAIFTVLAIASIGQPVAGTISLIFISLGQADRQLRLGLVATPIVILAFFIGLPWGPIGVATAYTIAIYLIRVPALYYSYRYSPIEVVDFIKAIWRPFTVSGLMFVVMYLSKVLLAAQAPLIRLICCCVLGGLSFFGAIYCWPSTRKESLRLVQMVKELWQRPRSTPSS